MKPWEIEMLMTGPRHAAAAAFGAHIRGNILYGSIIALGAGDDGFGDGNNIPVMQDKAFFFRSQQDAVRHDGGQVVPLTDDGAANATGHGTDSSGALFHTSSDSFPGLLP